MMTRTLATLAIVGFSSSLWAQQACQTDYQVNYVACKETGKILGTQPQVQAFRIVEGACQPNEQSLCQDEANRRGVRLVKAYHQDAEGKLCNKGLKVFTKYDVYCDFEVQAPVKEMVADTSCPVSGVTETKGCFDADKPSVQVDLSEVSDCLKLRPQSEAEWFLKGACLSDLYNAQNAFRLEPTLNSETFDAIKTQREIVSQKAPQTLRDK
jgi:hypothetical protein